MTDWLGFYIVCTPPFPLCACVRACVRARARLCVCVCVWASDLLERVCWEKRNEGVGGGVAVFT